MKVKVYDIEWDTDDESILKPTVDLPEEMEVEVDEEDEAIDRATDQTGFCIFSASTEEVQ